MRTAVANVLPRLFANTAVEKALGRREPQEFELLRPQAGDAEDLGSEPARVGAVAHGPCGEPAPSSARS